MLLMPTATPASAVPVPARFVAGCAGLLLLAAGLVTTAGPVAAAPWPTCVQRSEPIQTGLSEVRRAVAGRVVTFTLASRALQGEQRVEVLLPERFDRSGRTRYPVLYLLHGAGGDPRTWLERDGVREAVGDLPVIVVMPAGSDRGADGKNRNGSYTDWFGLEAGAPGPVPAWESHHVRELVPFIDRHLPTWGNAAGRAVAGISMGGGGAMKYAAAHPGTFGYAGSFSGSLDRGPDAGLNRNCVRGDPAHQEVVWRDNNPTDLAANLRGVRLFVRSGDGTPGPYDSPTPPSDPAERAVWQTRLGVEAATHRMAQSFLAALSEAGIDGADARFRPGSHSPPYWQRDLREFAGWLRGQLRHPPAAPRSFAVSSARDAVTAWDWSFRPQREVREFVHLRVSHDRAASTLTATGSGRLDVVTPARYRPGTRHRVEAGGTVRTVTADRRGRLAFPVDLGPSHSRQQTEFGPGATRDWRTVSVRIGPGCRPCAERTPAPPRRPERVVQDVVPLPATVTGVRFPHFTADGSRIVAAAGSTGFRGVQLVTFAADGSGLRCLTCGVWTGPDLLKPIPFPDGRRVLVRIGNQSFDTPADHGVVECTPSVLDCRRAAVVPIVPPAAGDGNVDQDQREFRLAPDGRHVALSQVRRTPAGRPNGVGIVGELVRAAGAYRVEHARVVAHGGELKGFTPDGQGVLFTRFLGAFEAGNPDDVVIDLRTGRERRATRALDWDEDIDIARQRHRGRGWMVVGSGRGTGLLETVSRLRRPPAIDVGVQALPFAVFTSNNPQMAEPWLVDEFDARDGYLGQPLAPGAVAAGWDSRPNFRWKPDGTAIIFWQQRIGGEQTRVVIARLPERHAARPAPVRTTPAPAWAPPLTGYVPADPELPRRHRGTVSGEIQIVQRPSTRPGFELLLQVTYLNYADECGFVLNGVERSYYNRPGLHGASARYTADLTVSGRHRGFLDARDVLIVPNAVRGTITSVLDGRRLTLGPSG